MTNSEPDLEFLLKQAAKDVTVRPQFIKAFLDCNLYVTGELEQVIPEDKTITLKEDSVATLGFYTINGKQQIPVFSSIEKMKVFVTAGTAYICLSGRALLQAVGGSSHVILNPGSDYGKEFTPSEIVRILKEDTSD